MLRLMFWKLFSQSVVITGTLALILVGTFCACILMGNDPPEVLVNLTFIVVAFFFGSKLPAIKDITSPTK